MIGIFDITTPISEEEITQMIGLLINILTAIGILIDPTTEGTSDSDSAMKYDKPN